MSHDPASDAPAGYEKADARVGPIAMFAAGLSALVAVVSVAMGALIGDLEAKAGRKNDRERHPLAPEFQEPPSPRLQANPPAELADYMERAARATDTYGWIDPEGGVVRIPVDRAMELVLERGLPVRDGAEDR